MTGRLDDLDDPDYRAYTTRRAAEVLGVRQAFLRALDTASAVIPERTAGGRRRYRGCFQWAVWGCGRRAMCLVIWKMAAHWTMAAWWAGRRS